MIPNNQGVRMKLRDMSFERQEQIKRTPKKYLRIKDSIGEWQEVRGPLKGWCEYLTLKEY